MENLYKIDKYDYESIKKYISEKKGKILSERVIDLFSKYFSSLDKINVLPSDINIKDLIDKALNNIKDCIFYDNHDEELLNKLGIGEKNKGAAIDSILYVNSNQTDEMIEITFYHELTHLLQNHSNSIASEDIGLMENYKFRLIMEAQTQYLAEMIYSNVHNKKLIEIHHNTEELRMLSGGTVRSNLRNYELYDCILTKLCLFLNISKETIIKLNFMGKNGCKLFREKIIDLYGEDVYDFIWKELDLIYATDVMIYVYDYDLIPDNFIVESLVDNRNINISSANQMQSINNLDKVLQQGIKIKFPENLDKFIPYIISNEERENMMFMPKNEEYAEVSSAPMEEVENNPKRFIMPECIPACKELWSKNIYTFMTSNYEDRGNVWIEIYAELSPENLSLLESLNKQGIRIDVYHQGCYRIYADGFSKRAADSLLSIAKKFDMQDVPKDIAYQTEEDFLISCGCYKKEVNHEYIEMKEVFEMDFSNFDEVNEYLQEYKKWQNSSRSKKYIIKFDSSKQEKSVKEYAKENQKII